MKKNDRCPLQVECERNCAHVGHELECAYYEANARDDLIIEDQEKIREARWKKSLEEDFERELAEIEDDDDDDDEGEDENVGLIQSAGKSERPIEVIEGEIIFFKAQATANMLEIGRRLIEAKEQLPHGQWQNWLAEKVAFSERSAQRFMRIAEGYSKTDSLSGLGATKALQLLAFEEVEREEFIAEKHEVNGEEKTVQEMTSAELDKAIKARKQAEEELAKVKQEKLDAEVRAENFAKEAEKEKANAATAKASGEKMAEDMKILKANLKDQKALAETSSAEAEKLKQELEALRDKPVDVAVREPSEEEIAEKAAAQIEAAKAEIAAQAEAARAEGEEKIRELEKQLAMADPETAVFRMRFLAWQEAYDKMMEQLKKVEAADSAKADKLRMAVKAAWKEMET